jgi:hypothetical protein
MLGVLLVICCRSLIFNVVNAVASEPGSIFILGFSAFVGKVAGGFLADKFGWKKFAYFGLIAGFLFLSLGRENMYALGFGVACLQSSVPLTVLLMSRSLPQYPAIASALSLGTAVAFAGLPFYLLMNKPQLFGGNFPPWIVAICFVIMLCIWMGIGFLTRSRRNYLMLK